MMKQFGDAMTSFLLSEKSIQVQDKLIYDFAARRILKNVIILFVIMFVASIFQSWTATLSIGLGFIPIRRKYGGYHSKSSNQCHMLTLISLVFLLICIKFTINVIHPYVVILLSLSSILTVLLIGPVDHKHLVFSKSLMIRKIKSGKKLLLSLGFFQVILMMKMTKVTTMTYGLSLGLFLSASTLLIGYEKRRREKYEIEEGY